jgi:hypothetical protein
MDDDAIFLRKGVILKGKSGSKNFFLNLSFY